ncbi:hypothetical protein MLAC_19210 [Mycobacterium lacus]|uniref:Zinc chelation protein SecC n=1 Tax=Mycobacterium lacus TaxID=169765 RepID=A0A7I7NM82_9MYCO|nr:hypothetical protein MLAC_19210 [Mycobacterium lacus]
MVAERSVTQNISLTAKAAAAIAIPGSVEPFSAWCVEQGREPDSPEARAEYAAHLTAQGDHDVIAWPPGRNLQCWCGSGRKYKKCCAAMSFIDTESAS